MARLWERFKQFATRVYSPDDDAEERRVKTIFLAITLMAAFGYTVAALVLVEKRTIFYHCIALAVFMAAEVLFMLKTRRLPRAMMYTAIVLVGFETVILNEWRTYGLVGYWSSAVVVMDLVLLTNSSDTFTFGLQLAVVLLVIAQSIEEANPYGLWDISAVGYQDYTRPEPIPWDLFVERLAVRLAAFLSDLGATKYFARSMMEEQRKVRASVQAAQEVALCLAGFNTDQASHLVQLHGDDLPPPMLEAFVHLIANLNSYRAYLPQSCLPAECEGDPGVEETEGTESETSEHQSHNKSPLEDFVSITTSCTSGSYDGRPRNNSTSQIQQSLVRKTVSLLNTNMVDYMGVITRAGVGQAVALHENLVSTVVASVREHKGLTDSFSGDRIFASFNTARPCLTHRQRAVACAKYLQHHFSDSSDASPTLICAVGSSEALVGVMGCPGYRRFTLLGRAQGWCFILERLATQWSIPVLIDQTVQAEAYMQYHCRYVEAVTHSKRHGKESVLYEPTVPKKLENDEWMYQMADGEARDLWDMYNKVAALIQAGKLVEAQPLLSSPAIPETHRGILECKFTAAEGGAVGPIKVREVAVASDFPCSLSVMNTPATGTLNL